ncbi:acyl-CoA thioesterase, partial [Bacillus thuringiensis]|uniref:acyl-CoA thioesterase n=1 Tax=Bacillus thuringiensis TaxID=1428 RepID=UPI0035E05FB7
MYIVKNEVNVRFGECDPMGIAHHSHYFHWFELGRFKTLDMTGISQYLKQEKLYFPIIDIGCTYKKSARFQDDLIVETYLKNESK